MIIKLNLNNYFKLAITSVYFQGIKMFSSFLSGVDIKIRNALRFHPYKK